MMEIVFGRLRPAGAAVQSPILLLTQPQFFLRLSTSWKAFSVYATLITTTYMWQQYFSRIRPLGMSRYLEYHLSGTFWMSRFPSIFCTRMKFSLHLFPTINWYHPPTPPKNPKYNRLQKTVFYCNTTLSLFPIPMQRYLASHLLPK